MELPILDSFVEISDQCYNNIVVSLDKAYPLVEGGSIFNPGQEGPDFFRHLVRGGAG